MSHYSEQRDSDYDKEKKEDAERFRQQLLSNIDSDGFMLDLKEVISSARFSIKVNWNDRSTLDRIERVLIKLKWIGS